MTALIVVSPSHRCNPQLAIAAARAGETGILDLGYSVEPEARRAAVQELLRFAGNLAYWGLRWDGLLQDPTRGPGLIAGLLGERVCPVLILAGVDPTVELLQQVRRHAKWIYLEATSVEEAEAAQRAGFDGVIAKGHEAGGFVGQESTFVLLQQLHGRLSIPYWAQGAMGPDTAAAAFLAGAEGVVLAGEVWMAAESSLDPAEQRQWAELDGSETFYVGDSVRGYRLFGGADGVQAADWRAGGARGADWIERVRDSLLDEETSARPLIALGQGIAFAKGLAQRHVNVAGILAAYRQRIDEAFTASGTSASLSENSPFARLISTKFPIFQAPLPRITDSPAFADAVATGGAVPFISLSRRDGRDVMALLESVREKMGARPWGVGLVDPVRSSNSRDLVEAVRSVRPTFALLADDDVELATQLAGDGVQVYLMVCSAPRMAELVAKGFQQFVLAGQEWIGPAGGLTSLALWQEVIELILSGGVRKPELLRLVFAGGIEDGLSAALVAGVAAPLAAKNVPIGLMLGTAYLFTREAVSTGCINETYQRRMLEGGRTVRLGLGGVRSLRALETPIVREFEKHRRAIGAGGKSSEAVAQDLAAMLDERALLAAKGIDYVVDERDPFAKGESIVVDSDRQLARGLYQAGESVTLRREVVAVAELHRQICEEGAETLQKLSARAMGWRTKVEQPNRRVNDIAIVGIACMFPKARDVGQYWRNICNRVDAIEEVPPGRWRPEDFFSEDRLAPDRVYSKWGGFLSDVVFDPVKWRIPPASLKSIEPIQLLALETASAAMKDAGYDKRDFPRERTGVIFAVAGGHDLGANYAFRTMMRHYLPQVEGLADETREQIFASLEDTLPDWTEDSFPGFLMNVVAGRIARELNVNGPNYVVDAACAASLAALHTAIEQLRLGTSDMMLVGAADATNNPLCYMSFSKTHALSPRGRSRPFDESGDGIALGEGVAVMVLKRRKDAERDGDKIYAVIKGIGGSSDGKNRSLTAPHPPGQAKALTRAYKDANISPANVTLVEAHGTGTVVGDSAEVQTLTSVFTSHSEEPQFAAVGSVKSMIGHTKTVAGLASLIKTALALKHGVLPPTIGVETPAKRVDFTKSPFYINTETRPWIPEPGKTLRRAGVSAFGFGGTNFHVVLEEYTGDYHPASELNLNPRPVEVFVWRRANREEILAELRTLSDRLHRFPAVCIVQLAASVHRDEQSREEKNETCRLGIVAGSAEEFKQRVDKALTLLAGHRTVNDPTGIYYSEMPAVAGAQVCFLYPGQGSQTVNMLRDLAVSCRWSHELFSRANRLLDDFFPKPLSRYLFPTPVFNEEDQKRQFTEISDTRIAQPALGVSEIFATDLLARFGVHPGKVAGHSYGEHVALWAAGCIEENDLIRLSGLRGKVCADVAAETPGGMAAVRADADATLAALKAIGSKTQLANLNAPEQTIIAGEEAEIESAIAKLNQMGLRATRIAVSAAFHTPLLKAGSDAMAEHFARVEFHRPRIPVYSNTTGAAHSDDPAVIRKLLTQHFSEPVLFEKEIRQIYADGARVFIEVGPGKVLSGLTARILKQEPFTTLTLDAPGRDGWSQLGHLLAQGAALGLPINLDPWFVARGLEAESVSEFFDRSTAQSKPKSSDWIISTSRAEPVVPLPAKSNTSKGLRAKFGAAPEKAPVASISTSSIAPIAPLEPVASVSHSAPEPAIVASAPPPAAPPSRPPAAVWTTANGVPAQSVSSVSVVQRTPAPMSNFSSASQGGESNGLVPAGPEMFLQFQATTRMFLEVQQSQNRLVERFLETQERMLAQCLGGAAPMSLSIAPSPIPIAAPAPVVRAAPSPPPSAAPANGRAPVSMPTPVAATVSAPAPRPAAVPAPAVVPTAASAAPAPIAAAAPKPVAPTPAPAPAKAATAKAAPVETKTLEPVAAGGPPSVDAFKQDLLVVVSERTGYPVDMLDVDLPLEAGLGIDSIKTVEIFSNLKEYHQFFRDDSMDEEETLMEFTKLKTLRDILDSYDRRRQTFKGGAPAANGTNGMHAVANGSVERYSVGTVEAPLEGSAGKKNSLSVSSSSY